MASRVFIVEDYARLRGLLEEVVHGTAGLTVCGSSETAEEALELLPSADPDLVLIDVALPGMNGLELLTKIRERQPETVCVMLSGHRSGEYAAQAMEAGARAYILKSQVQDLPAILRSILESESNLEATPPPTG